MWSPPENEPRRSRAQNLKVLYLVVALLAFCTVGVGGLYVERAVGQQIYFLGAIGVMAVTQALIGLGFMRAIRNTPPGA
jgi:hypothetical protein